MSSRWILSPLLFTWACGPVVSSDDGTSGEDTTTVTDTMRPTTSSSSEPPDPSVATSISTTANPTDATTDPVTTDPATTDPVTTDPTDDSDSCGDFIGCHDPSHPYECDLWAQDCPRGEKCMPWANDGGPHWTAARCSPIDAGNAPGDPCAVEGSYVSGIDSCALGSMCMFVDPKTNMGVCVTNCAGNEADPQCEEPSATCSIDFEGNMINCLTLCNPLLQDCADGGCYPTPQGAFVCAPTLGVGVIPGDGCVHNWDCAPGSVCFEDAMNMPGCEGDACCVPLCDLAMPEQCEDLSCTWMYGEGPSAVGVCIPG